MKYKCITDEEGYIIKIEKDDKGIDIDLTDQFISFMSCFKLDNGKAVLDEEKLQQTIAAESKDSRIAELERMLAETDYIQDGLISGMLQLKKPVTFIADLIALFTSTLTEYPTILAQRAEWIAELKSLKK